MDCEQIARDELVEKYLQGRLEPALERDFQVHLLECPECLALLETCEDIRDDLAPQAAAIEQKSEKPFWSLGGLVVPRLQNGFSDFCSIAAACGARSSRISSQVSSSARHSGHSR